MQTKQRSQTSVLQHLWHGIQAVGGFWPWFLVAGAIGFIVGATVVTFTNLLKQDLSGDAAWGLWKWSFLATILACAIATGYLAWNATPEDGEDEARSQR